MPPTIRRSGRLLARHVHREAGDLEAAERRDELALALGEESIRRRRCRPRRRAPRPLRSRSRRCASDRGRPSRRRRRSSRSSRLLTSDFGQGAGLGLAERDLARLEQHRVALVALDVALDAREGDGVGRIGGQCVVVVRLEQREFVGDSCVRRNRLLRYGRRLGSGRGRLGRRGALLRHRGVPGLQLLDLVDLREQLRERAALHHADGDRAAVDPGDRAGAVGPATVAPPRLSADQSVSRSRGSRPSPPGCAEEGEIARD